VRKSLYDIMEELNAITPKSDVSDGWPESAQRSFARLAYFCAGLMYAQNFVPDPEKETE
jgi:hypothetical protein